MYEVYIDKRLEHGLYSSEDFVFPNKPTLLKFIADNVDDETASFRITKINFKEIEDYDCVDAVMFSSNEVH